MQTTFDYKGKNSVTGFHVTLSGTFNTQDATELLSFLHTNHKDNERIFFDVRKLDTLDEKAYSAIKSCIAQLPSSRIIFKGEQGFKLAKQGDRVLLIKDHHCQCGGACKKCACTERVRDRDSKYHRDSFGLFALNVAQA